MNSLSIYETEKQPPHLSAEGLEVEFDGIRAIRGMDFRMEQGEMRFIIGPKGAGKTTFLDAVCGKVKPSRGRLLYRGAHDLTKFGDQQITRLGIGRKLNSSIFASLTVFENLLLSMRQSRRLLHSLLERTTSENNDRIVAILRLIGLENKAKAAARSLSAGEKQWLEIGMLLMQDPDLLLLDEPMVGMTDLETEKTGELLLRINEQKSLIVVEQDLEFVRKFARRVTIMHEGSILTEGSMNEVQNDERVAAAFMGKRWTGDEKLA
jgi:urea transport system ATP-binding protein